MSSIRDVTPEWVRRIVEDLRHFSADLLEPGFTEAVRGSTSDRHGSPQRTTMRAVDSLCARIPALLGELEHHERTSATSMEHTRIPWSSTPSKSPGDYVNRDGRLLPLRWLSPNFDRTVDTEPLRWLVTVISALREQLEVHSTRLGKQVETARFARSGDSEYAALDGRALDHMLSDLEGTKRALQQAIGSITRRVGGRVSPALRAPNPYPRTPAWQMFRRETNRYLYPEQFLGAWVGDILSEPIPVADVPYLYQRWCGLQILAACQRLGWQINGDKVGALYLGGALSLYKGGNSFRLWIEPRLSLAKATEIGWRSEARTGELTPDFLFVCGELGSRDAFVLDATLSTNETLLNGKGTYRDRMIGHDLVIIAGVPVLRRPVRSWAISPVRSRTCRLSDPFGYTGVIPLDAHSDDFSALEAWLRDVFSHIALTTTHEKPTNV